jgi:hypothetical protein
MHGLEHLEPFFRIVDEKPMPASFSALGFSIASIIMLSTMEMTSGGIFSSGLFMASQRIT